MTVRSRTPRATTLLLAAAVALTTAVGTGDAVAHSPRPAGLEGTWRMDGYGTVVSVENGGRLLRTYETTAVSCVPGEVTATRPTATGPFRQDGDVLTVNATGPDRAEFAFADNVGHRTLRRTAALPANCHGRTPPAPETKADPRDVFDVYWQTYAENYPFFAARNIDWNAVRDRFRPRVTRTTQPAELYSILVEMIRPLHDGHTGLVDLTRPKEYFSGIREDTVMPDGEGRKRIDEAVLAGPVGDLLLTRGNGQITYSEGTDRIGFLRITGFQNYGQGDGYEADKAVLGEALDKVFTAARTRGPKALRGLILDLRLNGGGSDRLALDVAERLTDRPYTAYLKHARNDARDPRKFTPAEPVLLRPHQGPVYTGPLAVLTGRLTMSAGETLTQALLGRGPKPTLIGENTQGLFSDKLERTLPNGWKFWLPNEEFLSAKDGRTTYDGAGIPPHIRTDVFTEKELTEGRDSALAEARGRLR
ncbi:S41 family peptidase [Streptomyces syringium]|uniref:S41 family peptidase n=1 Tax=Streptomyces syringium TaxID=76729 RepID=UPI003665C060